MKVVFIARHFTYFRNFESVVTALAERGHSVHLAADREEALGGRELVDRVAAAHPQQVTVGFTPILQWGRYRRLAGALRLGLDYLRYSDPRYDTTPRIRERAHERTPLFVLLLAALPSRSLVVWALERLEQAVPRQLGIDDFLTEHQPDILLVTPLIELGSPQLDYVRAARALGIRSALCVWSWDHLSSKALIRVVPDKLLVWNETQRDEARRFHGIPPERVIVTGAQCFDRWFDRQPSRDLAGFCARVGLPATAPFVLYVGSALFKGSPSEALFTARWADAVRRSEDPRLRDVPILVRPHPQRLDEWCAPEAVAALARAGVTVWGSNPVDPESQADYFDSLHHAAAVVGLNTSALVEAAIVDRPVFTLLLPEFRENQEGTFHFHHLMTVGDGFLNAARSLDEHVTQLAAVLADGAPVRANRPFVERFIRPRGVDVAATPVFLEALEQEVALGPPPPRPAPLWTLALRPLVYALVLAGRVPLIERIYWNPVKRREHAANVVAISHKTAQRREKRLDKLARVTRKAGQQAVVRTKTAIKQALELTGARSAPK